MPDPVALLHDLHRRVVRIEDRQRETAPPRKRPERRVHPDTEAILRFLRTNKTQPAEDRDTEAILDYLNKKTTPAAVQRDEGQAPKKGTLS